MEYIWGFDLSTQPLVQTYTYSLPSISIILYLGAVYYGPKLMEHRQPFGLKKTLQMWNLLLAILSVIMFVGMFPFVLAFFLDKGFYQLICLPNRELYAGPQMFFVWIFAMSKYIELFDTLFLILRKRPIAFLHYYHHTTVLSFTWFAMVTLPGAIGYIFSVINSAVHMVMYYYYYLAACGRPPTWAKYVTVIQLVQMIFGIIASLCWCYYYLTGANCGCDYPNGFMISAFLLYGSYLLLFLRFYFSRYTKPADIDKKPASARR
jgi:elongation of very long chain fatty acids protein 6